MKMVKIWSFWRPKLNHRSKFGEGAQKISSLKFIKIISVRIMDLNLVKNAINGGKFGQNRLFFMKMLKIGSFWGIKRRHASKFGERCQKFYMLKFKKIF